MWKIKFKNLEFKPNLNVTVRKGRELIERLGEIEDGNPFMVLKIVDENEKEIGFMFPWQVIVKKFDDIKMGDLMFEHDPKCRTVEGLKNTLEAIYGPMDPHEEVTLIYFITDAD